MVSGPLQEASLLGLVFAIAIWFGWIDEYVESAKTFVGAIATSETIRSTIKNWNVGDPNDDRTLYDFPRG